MPVQVIMPQLGESVIEGTVMQWLKAEGAPVERFEPLLAVNTDKVDTEIPSPAAGTLLRILVPEGETVRAGTVLAWIGQPGEAVEEEKLDLPSTRENTPSKEKRELGFISPVVARLAREHQIDLHEVRGTGEGGRITKKDVLSYIEERNRAAPATPTAPWETPADGDLFRPVELQNSPAESPSQPAKGRLIRLDPLRKAIAENLAASMRTAPHVTTMMEADMTRATAHRAAHRELFARDGVRLTFTAYFVSAIVTALKAYPIVNSSWTEEGILVHSQINIGMAVSLGDQGLIVPVIKNADGLSLLGLARTINDLAERTRLRRLQPDEVHGGTFTLTNHGTSGSLFATPVINQPQCGILGVGAIKKRVVVIEDMIAIRPMVYLSLTFDHRVVDGFTADGFLAKVVEALESW